MNLKTLIPQTELLSLYAPLPRAIKFELALWFTFAAQMSEAGSRNAHIVADLAAKLGCSPAQVRRKWTAWCHSGGDWKAFVNRAKAGPHWWNSDQPALPAEFIEHVRASFQWNQRCCRPAWRKLIRQWAAWQRGENCPIPGYAECPPCDPSGKTPVGWSYRNLMRYRPDDFELKASRVGRAAASQLRLHVFSSRVGLRVGEYIQLDDHETNLKVNFINQTRAMRPRLLAALDVFSACDFAQGFKPTLWDDRTQTKKVLREIDTMWLLIHILTTVGYRTDDRGTTFILEWGTANVPQAFCDAVINITGGRVKFDRSGKFGKASFTGLFDGAVKGNYRFKASRESLFNLLDNELADLPGQVGKDRDHSPEENTGLERYNNKLLQAAALLPAERASALLFPVLEWNQAIGLILDAFQRINHRTDHELEGWERAGLVTTEWRLDPNSPDWFPISDFLKLPPEKQSALRLLLGSPLTGSNRGNEIQTPSPLNGSNRGNEIPTSSPSSHGSNRGNEIPTPSAERGVHAASPSDHTEPDRQPSTPTLTRVRKLSPMEVFRAGRSELTPVARIFYPELVPASEAREVRVDSGLIEFQDKEISPDVLRYKASLSDTVGRVPSRGGSGALPNGSKYLGYVNPFDPAWIVLCRANGSVVGECPIWDAPCRNDLDAIRKKLGEAKQWESEALQKLGIRNIDRATARAAMHAHNASVLGVSPVPRRPDDPAATERAEQIAEVKVTEAMIRAGNQPDPEDDL